VDETHQLLLQRQAVTRLLAVLAPEAALLLTQVGVDLSPLFGLMSVLRLGNSNFSISLDEAAAVEHHQATPRRTPLLALPPGVPSGKKESPEVTLVVDQAGVPSAEEVDESPITTRPLPHIKDHQLGRPSEASEGSPDVRAEIHLGVRVRPPEGAESSVKEVTIASVKGAGAGESASFAGEGRAP
jgi:hypothetical protein